jgi:hypothetical protein
MSIFNSRLGNQVKQAVKSDLQKALSGNAVTDAEKRGFAEQGRTLAQQGLAAQQTNLSRMAMGAGSGSPVLADQFQKASEGIATASADASVKATGEANRLAADLAEQRKASALANADALRKENAEKVKKGLLAAGQLAAGAATGGVGLSQGALNAMKILGS